LTLWFDPATTFLQIPLVSLRLVRKPKVKKKILQNLDFWGGRGWCREMVHISATERAFGNPRAAPERKMKFVLLRNIY
jgi:hypothetical protein